MQPWRSCLAASGQCKQALSEHVLLHRPLALFVQRLFDPDQECCWSKACPGNRLYGSFVPVGLSALPQLCSKGRNSLYLTTSGKIGALRPSCKPLLAFRMPSSHVGQSVYLKRCELHRVSITVTAARAGFLVLSLLLNLHICTVSLSICIDLSMQMPEDLRVGLALMLCMCSV